MALLEANRSYTPQPYMPTPFYPMNDHCPKCGIKISGVMNYVCAAVGCPTFPQVTCGTGNISTTGG